MSTEPRVIVEAVALHKVFRDFWMRPKAVAVNNVDFTLREGQVLGFLGPNGSGKSTTVKMLLGLLRPTGGSLKVFGRPPSDVDIKHRIGYLPEETYLYRYLTAAETLDFFASLFNLPPMERAKRVDQLLKMVGLETARDRAVGEFSKGMARRIGLAQALINDPDLIILDEPTSGLDPIGCRDVKDLILTLKQRGKTVILCSHLLADVEDVCDEILIIYGGKIRARGPIGDLLADQQHTRIVTKALSPEMIDEVMAVLSKREDSEVAIDRPTRTLESFFMDVVSKAQEDSVSTAGAEAGNIAEYLKGEDAADAQNAVLRKLLDDQDVEAPAEPEPVAESAKEPAPDIDRLSALVEKKAEPEAAPAKPAADLSAESARLSALLGDGSTRD
ncbi:MAG: ABC-2 type transport system ATP-binding protein [Rhodothermales bacterium]|jgi:ABC-2 type transport system ATP-binding protein